MPLQRVLGGHQVLGHEPERLVDRDLAVAATSGHTAEQDLAQLADDVPGADRPFAERNQQVARLAGRRSAGIDVDAGVRDQGAVGLTRGRRVGADQVDVRTRRKPGAVDHRLLRPGHDADDVAGGGLLGRGDCDDPRPGPRRAVT